MRARWVSLSAPRRFIGDLMYFAAQVPSVPVQRRMALAEVVRARSAASPRPCWPAVFLKAFDLMTQTVPAFRRAYVALPWPHLAEYDTNVASVAIERDYRGEPGVFFGKISSPGRLSMTEIDARIRGFACDPIEKIKPFRKMLALARLPRPIRRTGLWLGLNLARTRPGQFGTFGISVYSSLGAESLHPISPLTTTLTYSVFDANGQVEVRFIYDHRVLDGATVARGLASLEEVLNGPVRQELMNLSVPVWAAA